METLLILWIVAILIFVVAVPQKSPKDRERDDLEQEEFLKDWEKTHDRKD